MERIEKFLLVVTLIAIIGILLVLGFATIRLVPTECGVPEKAPVCSMEGCSI